jgi:hypothetical protein
MPRLLRTIENRRVLADSGDLTINIQIRDIITALFIELRNVNGATNNQANLIADCIETIQLIDGSDVLCSVSGKEAFAAMAYKLGTIPYQLITELPGNTQNLFVPLLFGRWLGDQTSALDPTRYNNLQLRIKWNFATVTAVGATGFTAGTGTLTVIADVMEGAASPVGLLTVKRHVSIVTASSGISYIELPTDQPIKSMMIRAYLATKSFSEVVSNIKLGADQSKMVYLDQKASDLIRWRTLFDKPFMYKHLFHAANGDTVYPILKHDETVALQNFSGDNVLGYTNNGNGQGALTAIVAGSAQTSDISIDASVQGYLPFGTLQHDFGDFDDPETWLTPTGIKSLQLELTNAYVGGAVSVVLEQLRLY